MATLATSSPLPVADGGFPCPVSCPPGSRRHARYEEVPRPGLDAITVRHLAHTHLRHAWHFHPEVELTLIVHGRGLRFVGDSISRFESGDLCLVAGGTPHCWRSEPGGASTDEALIVQFPPHVFGRGFLELVAARPLSTLLERASHGLLFAGATREEAISRLWRLADPGCSPLERLNQLAFILARFAARGEARALSLATLPSTTGAARRTHEVLRFIHEHADERLSSRDVARVARMSPNAFGRYFTRQFGRPFTAYLAEVRVGHVCRLLLEENHSISETAWRAGFHNLASFNRLFLRLKGMTPSAYRKLARVLDPNDRRSTPHSPQPLSTP